MNEDLGAQMVKKDLGEIVGALERRAPRENLVTRAQPGCWEHVDSQDPRGNLVLQDFLVTRDSQERMESLVSEEKKEILASWVPGASRVNGGLREPVASMERREIREKLVLRAALGWQDARETRGSRVCPASQEPLAKRALSVPRVTEALMGSQDPRVTRVRKGSGAPQELGVSQVPGAMKAPVVPLGRLAVLVPKDLKDFRARRVSEGPLERVWWAPLVLLGPPEREGSRDGQGLLAPVGRREQLR